MSSFALSTEGGTRGSAVLAPLLTLSPRPARRRAPTEPPRAGPQAGAAAQGRPLALVAHAGQQGSFGVAVSFDGDQVVLAVRGEVDCVTAGDLAGLLGAVIDRGHRRVVLDLAGCGFMDAAGLRVLAEGADRLAYAGPGAGLALSSPSAMVRRILAITGLTERIPTQPTGSLDITDAELVDRLSEALRARQVIAVAQGVLMARAGVTENQAFAALRRHSQRTSTPLLARAEAVAGSTQRPGPRPGAAPGGGDGG